MEDNLDLSSEEEVVANLKTQCMHWCRTKRNQLLSETDYIFLPDVNVSDEYLQAMLTYRQSLRDYPEQFSDQFDSMSNEERYGITPLSIPFPEKPTQS